MGALSVDSAPFYTLNERQNILFSWSYKMKAKCDVLLSICFCNLRLELQMKTISYFLYQKVSNVLLVITKSCTFALEIKQVVIL